MRKKLEMNKQVVKKTFAEGYKEFINLSQMIH